MGRGLIYTRQAGFQMVGGLATPQWDLATRQDVGKDRGMEASFCLRRSNGHSSTEG